MVLVGNKIDADEQRIILKSDGLHYAKEKFGNIPFLEVSAKTGTDINLAIITLVQEIIKDRIAKPRPVIVPYVIPLKSVQSNMINDVKKFVNNEEFHDIVFKTESMPIYANKLILQEREPILIVIAEEENFFIDTQYKLLLTVMEYIYTGNWDRPKNVIDQQLIDITTKLHKIKLPNLLSYIYNRTPISFETFFNSKVYSDITIIVEGKEIFAHKIILCMRNVLFNTMLHSNFKESTQEKVHLTEFSYDTIFTFINYLYSDKCTITGDNVTQLLHCCKFYQEHVLLNKCELFISEGLTVENVCYFYKLCIYYSMNKLKTICARYILLHFDDVKQTPSFTELPTLDQKLLYENKIIGIWLEPGTELTTLVSPTTQKTCSTSFFSKLFQFK